MRCSIAHEEFTSFLGRPIREAKEREAWTKKDKACERRRREENGGEGRERKGKEGQGRKRKEKEGEGRKREEEDREGRRRKGKEGEGRKNEASIDENLASTGSSAKIVCHSAMRHFLVRASPAVRTSNVTIIGRFPPKYAASISQQASSAS